MAKKGNYRWDTWGEVFRHYKRKGYYLAYAAHRADEYMKRRKRKQREQPEEDS